MTYPDDTPLLDMLDKIAMSKRLRNTLRAEATSRGDRWRQPLRTVGDIRHAHPSRLMKIPYVGKLLLQEMLRIFENDVKETDTKRRCPTCGRAFQSNWNEQTIDSRLTTNSAATEQGSQ